MRLLTEPIDMEELSHMAQGRFGDLVKAVVDIERSMMVVDAELQADEESLLLENGSLHDSLWGINLYPALGRNDEDFLEFDSVINLRPSQNNRSRGVEDPRIREKIVEVVSKWIR